MAPENSIEDQSESKQPSTLQNDFRVALIKIRSSLDDYVGTIASCSIGDSTVEIKMDIMVKVRNMNGHGRVEKDPYTSPFKDYYFKFTGCLLQKSLSTNKRVIYISEENTEITLSSVGLECSDIESLVNQ